MTLNRRHGRAAPPGRATLLLRRVALLAIAAGLLALTLSPLRPLAADRPCGDGSACQLAGEHGGEYHLAYPRGWDGRSPLGVLVYFHGHRSNGANVVKNSGLRRAFGDAGYLIVAPTGSASPGRTARGWPGRRANGRRDDIAFTHRVLDDVAQRVPVDPARTVVSGFSSGGSMAWYLACHGQARPGGALDGERARRFASFVAVAGGLRRPIPAAACPSGPFPMLHIHGFGDTQVPLEGRGIREWHQGDVFEGLGIARAGNQCRSQPSGIEQRGRFQCRRWDGCGTPDPIEFCLHDGGHGLPSGWTALALDWFGHTPER